LLAELIVKCALYYNRAKMLCPFVTGEIAEMVVLNLETAVSFRKTPVNKTQIKVLPPSIYFVNKWCAGIWVERW